jgi:perosamine synthetase
MRTFIPISQPSLGDKELEYITNAVRSGWVSSLGTYIKEFEQQFASFCGTNYALSTCNATVALHLALCSYDIGSGDEVIVPELTFVATANAVAYTGATPVFVDIDPVTLCIDPEAIRAAITPRTKAIIPVHLYGHPADMPTIMEIAHQHHLIVIEDAAEAHGANIKGIKVGSWGDCAVFSFYGNKIITSGEGGMITTNDRQLAERASFLKDHGMDPNKRYWHTAIGYNYRMTNLQAAIGLAQLERIDTFIAKKRAIFASYQQQLQNIPHLRLNRTASWAFNVYWMICAEIDEFDAKQRDMLMQQLKGHGIDSRPYFYPISDMPMYRPASTPSAHRISQRGLCLPSYNDISDDDITYICSVLTSLLSNKKSS